MNLITHIPVFALAQPEGHKTHVGSPGGFLAVLGKFFKHLQRNIRPDGGYFRQQVRSRRVFWEKLFTFTVLTAYLYMFMEWIFMATMPSFMSLLSWGDRVEIFLLSGLALSIVALIALTIFILLDIFALSLRREHLTSYLWLILPTLILSALALLLIDNFTYTMFKFGISTTAGVWRGVYGLLFLALAVVIFIQLLALFGLRRNGTLEKKTNRLLFFSAISLLVLSASLAAAKYNHQNLPEVQGKSGQADTRPNIILLGSDGMSAQYLSVYGYYHATTPVLSKLAPDLLVAENAFTNSGNTAGSVISILTSKLPTQTRVLYPPDILNGVNAFQHLPGILKNEGYRTVEFGVQFYVDAYSFNLLEGFDKVNNQTKGASKFNTIGQKLGYENAVYFLSKVSTRISERLQHIFYIHTMQNPYKIVTHPISNMDDEKKVSQLLDVVDQSEAPVFIHAHLLGTHGGYYSPDKRVFSTGEQQTRPWMEDFYADSILGFDGYVSQVIDHLKANNEWENTILIIYSDHGKDFSVDDRIPLLIHFPGDQYAGRVTTPAGNIDIAPTILDYLGLSEPVWMVGESLLQDHTGSQRLIFSMGTSKVRQNENDIYVLDSSRDKPPFYQFSFINVVSCQEWYKLDLASFQWTSGEVAGYVNPCSKDSLPSFAEIKQAALQQLAEDGLDVSSIP